MAPIKRPLPFTRKHGLGHYNEPRSVWDEAYRQARIHIGRGGAPDHKLSGVRWKAQLIVAFERNGDRDRFALSAQMKLDEKRLIDEVIGLC